RWHLEWMEEKDGLQLRRTLTDHHFNCHEASGNFAPQWAQYPSQQVISDARFLHFPLPKVIRTPQRLHGLRKYRVRGAARLTAYLSNDPSCSWPGRHLAISSPSQGDRAGQPFR